MQATDFIRKWGPGGPAHALNERAGAQAHFIDLCRVLGVAEPGDADNYCFERGVTRTGAGQGFADVWLRNHFAWEYKAPGKNLDGALRQLMMYALPLDNPPLLVVSDRQRIEIHTHFTGTPSERHVFALEDLTRPEVQNRLRALWQAPDSFKPSRNNRQITEEAASTFADTAKRLRDAGVPADAVSHFLTQCVFCFFAEDVGLLPARLFERLVGVQATPERLRVQLQALLQAMQGGGLFGVDDIPWFNGGLFKTIAVPPLVAADVAALKAASSLNWSAIDATIFGTLFERGLDPAKRSQLGANFTDAATIGRLVEPVVSRPLRAEWAVCKGVIEAALGKSKRHGDKAYRDAQAAFAGFIERLKAYRVLDPACGSGNFLYLALKALKDIEHQVNLEAEALGLQRQYDVTGPHNVLGIELNEYAAELARVTVWIGELQWRIQRGYAFKLNPVLEPLDHIETRDAVLGADGREAVWPEADVVVGNPPFVGDKKMRAELGDDYVEKLRAAFGARVPGGVDLVCYWFERARGEIAGGRLQRAGLVATNSIRGGASREVLEAIARTTRVFEAWSDQPWVNEGAAVRVSMVAFGHAEQEGMLDGIPTPLISTDLRPLRDAAGADDLTMARTLASNSRCCFQGAKFVGDFTITQSTAAAWLRLPANPGGQPNSLVLRRWINGMDVTRRAERRWVVDFGCTITEEQAALFEAPFEFLRAAVRDQRSENREQSAAASWWRHQRPRPDMRAAQSGLPRWIATPEVAKHRLFVSMPPSLLPSGSVYLIARADDTTLGILHSRFHELWSLRLGTSLEDRPRYTPTTCFETFPFPAGLTPADTAHQRTEQVRDGEQPSPQPSPTSGRGSNAAAPGSGVALIPADLPPPVRVHAETIARAAKRLTDLRDAWLNPPEWTERVPEVVPLGMSTSPYPDRIVARPGFEADLAKRTLTNLYNQRPAWLANVHAMLDAAVAAAYGWPDITAATPDDELLRRLLALNRERAGAGAE